ncbi:MAG TPA: BBE domain-containing protein, partial [Acidimicrobiia bacterium]|nr:BBE domain-containing protein [Acidimicrobiia bacterium]
VFGGGWLTDLSDEAIDVLVADTLPVGGPPALVFSEVRHAGGSISTVDEAGSAYGNRRAEFLLSALGVGPDPQTAGVVGAHLEAMMDSLAKVRAGGAYLNFLDGPARRLATRRGVSDFDRLAAVKAKYDPADLMSHGLDLTG